MQTKCFYCLYIYQRYADFDYVVVKTSYILFQVLLEFLERVIGHQDCNKMSLNNVAMIMAPNLFMAPKVRGSNAGKNKAVWDIEIKMAANTSNIMKMLIRYRGILWTVSCLKTFLCCQDVIIEGFFYLTTNNLLNFFYGIIHLPFLELCIIISRDIKMKTWSWSAKSKEPGQTAQM